MQIPWEVLVHNLGVNCFGSYQLNKSKVTEGLALSAGLTAPPLFAPLHPHTTLQKEKGDWVDPVSWSFPASSPLGHPVQISYCSLLEGCLLLKGLLFTSLLFSSLLAFLALKEEQTLAAGLQLLVWACFSILCQSHLVPPEQTQ